MAHPCAKWLAGAASVLFALTAHAVLPTATLSFVQPTGTVTPGEVIDVWMRLTIDTTSPALSFGSDPLTGFAQADLPTEGQYYNPNTQQYETHAVASITGAYLNTFFGCDDTFTGNCNNNTTNYSYSFFTTSQPGKPSINYLTSFNLAPGASFDYVFAQFTPAAGGAQPGTYYFYKTGVTLNFNAFDAAGNALVAGGLDVGTTCSNGNSQACAFSRTVVAVPEPASYALLAVGLLGIAGVARRGRPQSLR